MSPSGDWEELQIYHMPRKTRVAATQILVSEFETTRITEGEDPLLSLGNLDEAAAQLVLLRCSKSVKDVNQNIVRNLSVLYTTQSKYILARPNILRAEIDKIFHEAHFIDKVEDDVLSKAMVVKGVTDPQALYAAAVNLSAVEVRIQVEEEGTVEARFSKIRVIPREGLHFLAQTFSERLSSSREQLPDIMIIFLL